MRYVKVKKVGRSDNPEEPLASYGNNNPEMIGTRCLVRSQDLNVICHNAILGGCIALDCRAVSELRFHQSCFMAEHLHGLV
jgi:hypothetical protein